MITVDCKKIPCTNSSLSANARTPGLLKTKLISEKVPRKSVLVKVERVENEMDMGEGHTGGCTAEPCHDSFFQQPETGQTGRYMQLMRKYCSLEVAGLGASSPSKLG